MIHSVYLIRNKLNEKYYFGVHSSVDPNDSYFGSGKSIINSIKKYGKDNFEKFVLFECDSIDEAYRLESIIVTNKTVQNPYCYNQKCGGYGGFNNTTIQETKRLESLRKVCEKRRKPLLSYSCGFCQTSFESKNTRKFCSKSCASAFNNNKRKGVNTPNTTCSCCNTPLYKQPNILKKYNRHFCNKSCSASFKFSQLFL